MLDRNSFFFVSFFIKGFKGQRTMCGLPESVPTHLTRLETLFLQRNELMTLPASLKALHRLHTLDVSFNQLFELPHGFASMTTLRALRLSYNELELASLTLDGLKVIRTQAYASVRMHANSWARV